MRELMALAVVHEDRRVINNIQLTKLLLREQDDVEHWHDTDADEAVGYKLILLTLASECFRFASLVHSYR